MVNEGYPRQGRFKEYYLDKNGRAVGAPGHTPHPFLPRTLPGSGPRPGSLAAANDDEEDASAYIENEPRIDDRQAYNSQHAAPHAFVRFHDQYPAYHSPPPVSPFVNTAQSHPVRNDAGSPRSTSSLADYLSPLSSFSSFPSFSSGSTGSQIPTEFPGIQGGNGRVPAMTPPPSYSRFPDSTYSSYSSSPYVSPPQTPQTYPGPSQYGQASSTPRGYASPQHFPDSRGNNRRHRHGVPSPSNPSHNGMPSYGRDGSFTGYPAQPDARFGDNRSPVWGY